MATKKGKGKREGLMAMERQAILSQGIALLVFGVAAVFWPGLTVIGLVYIAAVFLAVDGLFGLFGGFMTMGRSSRSLWLTLLGLVQVVASAALFMHPHIVLATVLWVLAAMLVVRGLFAFLHALSERALMTAKVLHGIQGLVSVLLGLVLFTEPVGVGTTFVWVLGLYALLVGPIMIAIAADLGVR